VVYTPFETSQLSKFVRLTLWRIGKKSVDVQIGVPERSDPRSLSIKDSYYFSWIAEWKQAGYPLRNRRGTGQTVILACLQSEELSILAKMFETTEGHSPA
jgi:hypothetical protein